MSQRFGGNDAAAAAAAAERFHHEPPHVAQQSRRDKLRFQQYHQFEPDDVPNPSSGSGSGSMGHNVQHLIYNYMFTSPGVLDYASVPATAASCENWILNQMNPGQQQHQPLIQSQLYQLPISAADDLGSHENNQQLSSYHHQSSGLQALAAAAASSSYLRLDHHQQQQQQQLQPLKVEGGVYDSALASCETQGLSLSLASKPHAELPVLPPKSSADAHRGVGPLGPFTGYATILESSKFLRPTQQLLDEFCIAVKGSELCAASNSRPGIDDRRWNAVGGSADGSIGGVRRGGNSGVSSFSFYGSMKGGSGDDQGRGCSGANCSTQPPEIQKKKVRLLYLQEEVCRRYKQYHQQMQMVVSSFESVAGLSAATPYTSLAIKAISKQFRSVKQAISNQLHHVSRVLVEDIMSLPSSSSQGDTTTTPRLKHIEQTLRKQKARENTSLGFLDNSQPVWRPQRGLPDRAVSVLRAWLFEHFLHPYPTDTDKHMLATQTGLTRNQVSNWFINARVRLWKPMVEEIHMLESNTMSEMDLNFNKNDGKLIMGNNGGGQSYPSDQGSDAQSNKRLDCSDPMDQAVNELSSVSLEQWHREKRSRMEECGMAGGIDGGLMSIAYQGGMDIRGLGAVSLTLGLRHSEESQQQPQMEMGQFGGQMLHDFVG